ncbi:SDR family NAD(P)-dependent oxidoreductase [uncultured Ruthenibacterium sp.]|uniref:SDR family NAD(P)-dependent oxidoreductase n=1 Tax=uncultured Ruthenibacterium sp. TaxID=1905347 RepID=UPI00349ECF49
MNKKNVCVITGGSSGIGLATAKQMGQKGYSLVLAARTPAKLNSAIAQLRAEGISAQACRCDVGDWESVKNLAALAQSNGTVTAVLHIAGMSPHMGDEEAILRGNALGTIHMHDAFYPVLDKGGCIVDTSSMSAYLAPKFIMPQKAFALAKTDRSAFLDKLLSRIRMLPKKSRPGAAYAISKYFVIWYVRCEAARFGTHGVRVLSITPGNFDTPMGALEQKQAQSYLRFNALKRSGKPEEIATLFAAVSDPEMGYLTGCDILCDGGCVAGKLCCKL